MNALDVYSVHPQHKAQAEAEVRLCESDWRNAGGIAATALHLEQARQRAQQLQSAMDEAVAQSRPGTKLRYYRFVHLFIRTGVRRLGRPAFVGLAVAVIWAASIILSALVCPTFPKAFLSSIILSAFGALVAVTVAIGAWPSGAKEKMYQLLNREWLGRTSRVEAIRPVLQQAWATYESLRGHAELFDRLEKARQRLAAIDGLLASAKYRLVSADWRSMRGIPFEQFLSEVLGMLGYAVEATKASGDQGVDLIAAGKGRRIAIQAKGYEGSVGNHAVMEVYTGMRIYSCDGCVVITNSSFTRSAMQAAQGVGCLLVDGPRIPELIEGQIL